MAGSLVASCPIPHSVADVPIVPRSRADFIAQLIATSAQLPQTRARRRAEPRDAAAAYAAITDAPTLTGSELSRSL